MKMIWPSNQTKYAQKVSMVSTFAEKRPIVYSMHSCIRLMVWNSFRYAALLFVHTLFDQTLRIILIRFQVPYWYDSNHFDQFVLRVYKACHIGLISRGIKMQIMLLIKCINFRVLAKMFFVFVFVKKQNKKESKDRKK